MDKATIGGILGSIAMVLFGILIGSGIGPFVNPPSMLIVVGGTIGVMFTGYPGAMVKGAVLAVRASMVETDFRPDETILLLSQLSRRARREGLLALESVADETEDQFLAKGLRLMADGHDQPTIESVLYDEIGKMDERHKDNIGFWEFFGMMAPAFGMIGTLIGLVQMLQSLEDPTTIGPAMAVALLTTLYGSLMANVFAIPLANKMKLRSEEEQAHKELVATGLLSILAGENPRFMVDRLNSTLAPAKRMEEAA